MTPLGPDEIVTIRGQSVFGAHDDNVNSLLACVKVWRELERTA